MGLLKRIADRMEANAERNKQRHLKREQEQREMYERIKKGEPPQSASESIYRAIYSQATKPHVFTCPQGVITYKFNIELGQTPPMDYDSLQQKLSEILAANPRVDLTLIAPTLGITIIDDQRSQRQTPDTPDTTEGIIIGRKQ